MTKTFEFDDGGRAVQWDTASGRVATWTMAELNCTLRAFCKTHSPQDAVRIMQKVCGVRYAKDIPTYAIGTVIALLCYEMTGRQHRHEVSLLPDKRKDDA